MAQYQLPSDFFFGAAMSGPQTEGQWNPGRQAREPVGHRSMQDLGSFYNRVGSYAGNDFMAKYKDDLRIMKDLGSIPIAPPSSGSRLLDADGNLNEEGAAWYHELFRASREAGLEPFVNLYHFDMPTYLFDRGGWESREVVEAYAHYADVAFREFGQEIKYWFTFNEPIVEPEQRTVRACGSRSSTTSTVLAPCSTTFRWRTRWLLPTIARPMTRAPFAPMPRSA